METKVTQDRAFQVRTVNEESNTYDFTYIE